MAKSLKLTPEAIKKCMDACDALIDGLEDQLGVARSLGVISGFGKNQSAMQLQTGFQKLANGGPDSAYQRTQEFIEIAKQIKANFAAGGEGFAQMEQEFSDVLRRSGSGLRVKRQFLYAAIGLGCFLGIAGCSSGGSTGQAAAPTATASATAAVATNADAHPEIPFQPCRDLTDSTLVELGYRTDYRHPVNGGGTEENGQPFNLLGCNYKSTDYRLGVSSGTRSLADQRTNPSADAQITPVTINGRAGFTDVDPAFPSSCVLAFETSYGEVILSRVTVSGNADVCAGIEQSAEIIASILPKGA